MNKFLIGCDPEIFLADAAGALISAVNRVGGSKETPMPLPALGDGFAVQEDNVAVEFNIKPAGDAEEFKSSIKKTVDLLSTLVGHQGLHFVNLSAASFPEDQLNTPQARMFGCDPDYDVWARAKNPRPESRDKNLRSCGGHVHVGYEFADQEQKALMVKAMDLYLAVPSVFMDTGELRKELYGKAGAFRFKPYGLEYRTLSNYWIFNDRLIEWVWKQTDRALDAVLSGIDLDNEKDNILQAINKNDKVMAGLLVKKYNLEVIYA